MQAVEILGADQVHVRDLEIPSPGSNELLVRVMASGICGTDLHIARGEYMGRYPVIPGHEFSGHIEEIGPEVQGFTVGDRVAVEPNLACGECDYCLQGRINHCRNWEAVGVTRPGGMSEFVLVPESAAFSIGDLEFEQAAFMEPLSCVIHGFEKLDLAGGDRVLLMGAGPIGLMFAQLLRDAGVDDLTLLERKPGRQELATKLTRAGVVSDITDLDMESFNVVIDATGAVFLMKHSMDLVRKGGSILLFGVPPMESRLDLDAFQLFEKGLSLHCSFTSVRNSEAALDLIREGKVRVSEIISHRLPLKDFPQGIRLLDQGAEDVNKVMILPQS